MSVRGSINRRASVCGLALVLGLACQETNPAFVLERGGVEAGAVQTDLRADPALDGGWPLDAPTPFEVGVSLDLSRLPDMPADTLPRDTLAADAPSAAAVELTTGLVGYWKLDEASGSSAADSSRQGNDGMLIGLDPTQSWQPGKRGSSVQIPYDFTLHGIRVIPTARLNTLQRFTISAWVYRIANPNLHTSIVSRQLNNSLREVYNLTFDTGELLLYVAPSATAAPTVVRAGLVTPVGVWTHVAASFDGSTLRLYLNGVMRAVAAHAMALAASSNPIFLGNNLNPSPTDLDPLGGRLDEVLFYDKALSLEAIQLLAADTTPAGY